MKTKVLMVAIAMGLVLTAADANAQGRDGHMGRGPGIDFATMDLDSDGSVTMEEIEAAHAARFADADTDGDGGLSADELTAQATANNAERMARGIERMLSRMDENEDGILQMDEMKPRGGRGLDRMFSHLDADEDGAISADEFEAAKAERGEGRGRGGHGRGHGDRDHGKRG